MKYAITILLVAIVGVFFFTTNHPVVEDIKLQSTRVWSFFTIGNNPLLPALDRDLQAALDSGMPTRVDPHLLIGGGPPKDGIPSIDNPQFEPITETRLSDDELIIGVVIDGEAKAYPYAILNWHEIVNDTLAGVPIAVTYCPLCESNSVFRRVINTEAGEQEVTFGVSGKLFQSCLVMFDRLTDSMYSQVWGNGIVGSQTNAVLERLPAIRTTIGDWRAEYPNSQILTTDTGFRRDYSQYPYGTYYTNSQIIFPVRNQQALGHHPKTITQIIFDHDSETTPQNEFTGAFQAFTQDEVRSAGSITFAYPASATTTADYRAVWDNELATIRFEDETGREVPNMAIFSFVLPAYFMAGMPN